MSPASQLAPTPDPVCCCTNRPAAKCPPVLAASDAAGSLAACCMRRRPALSSQLGSDGCCRVGRRVAGLAAVWWRRHGCRGRGPTLWLGTFPQACQHCGAAPMSPHLGHGWGALASGWQRAIALLGAGGPLQVPGQVSGLSSGCCMMVGGVGKHAWHQPSYLLPGRLTWCASTASLLNTANFRLP